MKTQTKSKLFLLLVSAFAGLFYAACTPPPDAPGPSTPFIESYPSDATTNLGARFVFYSDEGSGALYYKCSLNNGPEFDCGMSTWGVRVTYDITVPGGENTFRVRAVDDRGKSSGYDSYTWLADNSAPVGGSISGPSLINQESANLNIVHFQDPHSGIFDNALEMQTLPPAGNINCAALNWSSASWEYMYDGQLYDLDDGCYRFRLTGENNVGLEANAWHHMAVDTTAPSGGRVSSPANNTTGLFSLSVDYFSDSFSGIDSNVLQVRSAPLSSDLCPAANSNNWSSWQATGVEQERLPSACYQYRLLATDKGGLQAVAQSGLTRVKVEEEEAGSEAAGIRILSLTGPNKAKQGKKALYVLRVRNVSEEAIRSITGRAYGPGVSSLSVESSSIQSGSTQRILVPVTFKKAGKIKVSFVLRGDEFSDKKKTKTIRVRAKKQQEIPAPSEPVEEAPADSDQEAPEESTPAP